MDGIITVLGNNLPWVWVAITVICIVIETMTFALTTIWFAISAFVMVFLAFTPIPFPVQLLIFVALSMILLIFTRPVLQKKLDQKKIATNYERVIGQIAVVTKKITAIVLSLIIALLCLFKGIFTSFESWGIVIIVMNFPFHIRLIKRTFRKSYNEIKFAITLLKN